MKIFNSLILFIKIFFNLRFQVQYLPFSYSFSAGLNQLVQLNHLIIILTKIEIPQVSKNYIFHLKDIILAIKQLNLRRSKGYTRSVRKVSSLPLYLRAIVFERPLRGMGTIQMMQKASENDCMSKT